METKPTENPNLDEGLRRRTAAATKAEDTDTENSTEPKETEEKPEKPRVQFRHKKPASFRASAISALGVILTVASVFTRVYQLSKADFVVWDEAHFGKFASFYIRHEFYHDVHPPLGKMLLGASGLFVGYNGSFQFESGEKYPPTLNYTGMRAFCSIVGAMIVPLSFYTGLQLKMSVLASTLLGLMVMLEISLLLISRMILLDSLLLFFTALSCYCFVVFRNYQRTEPLSPRWHVWMAFTGMAIGATLSVKWVGLFVIALVGLCTIEDLWVMLGDLKMPLPKYAYHWFTRIIFLILLPAAVYIFSFYLHFAILNESGEGDAQMSSLFQANLKGSNFHENPLSVAYGSKITLKNNARGGGLLHSHVQRYPAGVSGSEQQQITCYHHKDINNNWVVVTRAGEAMPEDDTVRFLYDGDIIRLQHEQTNLFLHSHPLVAPITKSQWEVSAFGLVDVDDPNDLWQVEIVKDSRPKNRDLREVRSLTTGFALRHVALGCLLHSGDGVNYPEWGFKQAEVYCDKSNDTSKIGNLWNVEQHWNPLLPPGGAAAYPKSFWRDFIDLNVGMWVSNNALTPDPTKEPDAIVSQPHQWPFMDVGLRICGWGDDEVKFYLLGNPAVWLGATFSLIVFCVIVFIYLVRSQRRCGDWKSNDAWEDFVFAGQIGVGGWFLHYFPFFIMARVTYLHHYFPALYFSIIMYAYVVDHLAMKLGRIVHAMAIIALCGLVGASFWYFADFAFGMEGPADQWKDRKWREGWNIYG